MKKNSTKTPAADQPTMDFAASTPRAETLPNSAVGQLWRMSGRHGVAYVRDAALAGELLKTEPKNLARTAMAVYYDKKGRAFAWQVRFDTARWDEIAQQLA